LTSLIKQNFFGVNSKINQNECLRANMLKISRFAVDLLNNNPFSL